MCVVERITDYCDAILATDDLCKPGLKCCVFRDDFGEKPPPYLVIPNKTKNATRPEVQQTTARPMTTTTATTTPTTESYKTPFTPRPTVTLSKQKPCNGECISGWFALLCEEYDSEAYCPGEANCCVTSPVNSRLSRKNTKISVFLFSPKKKLALAQLLPAPRRE